MKIIIVLNDDFVKWLSQHKGGVQGVNTFGVPLLDATMWHLGTLVPLKGGVQGVDSPPMGGERRVLRTLNHGFPC